MKREGEEKVYEDIRLNSQSKKLNIAVEKKHNTTLRHIINY